MSYSGVAMFMAVVVWDLLHQEFSILDGYYFSKLKKLIESMHRLIIPKSPEDWKKADILVFNYPEIPFKEREVELIDELAKEGVRIVGLSYYDNHDGVAGILSDVFREFGMKFEGRIEKNGNLTPKGVFLPRESQVVFPYSAKVIGGKALAVVEEAGIPMAVSEQFPNVIGIGSCVFWDNFSIEREKNTDVVNWLLNEELKEGNSSEG